MSSRNNLMRGVVHGKMIELEAEPGLPDGQAVHVTLEPLAARGEDRLRRAFGAWADDAPQLDEFIEGTARDREADRPEPAP